MWNNAKLFLIISVIGVIGAVSSSLFLFTRSAPQVQGQKDVLDNSYEARITTLEQQVESLSKLLAALPSKSTTTATMEASDIASLKEKLVKLENQKKEPIRQPQKQESDALTALVSKTSPAVVSIVVSKDVPLLEVVYQNPFGDDPFFEDIGIRVPVYRQKGVQKKKVGAGTGFLISGDGYIVTNKHVVYDPGAEYMVLLSDGKQKKAKVEYRDPTADIAVLKIEGSAYPRIALGNSDSVQLGASVIAIGNALGEYNNSISRGIISGLNRAVNASSPGQGTEELKGVIQTDAAINPGNSGGPLVTLDGKVIGVNVATVMGSNNISFAIPVNRVRDIVRHFVPGI